MTAEAVTTALFRTGGTPIMPRDQGVVDNVVMPAASRPQVRLTAPPHVPEMRLELAASDAGLWDSSGGDYHHDQPPPFWAFAWSGGVALARYLLDHPESVRGRRVVDLGAGSGIVAIAAAMAGATDVLAVDADPEAVAAARRNAAANGVEIRAVVADALASDGAGVDAVVRDGVDVLAVGDMFYSAGQANGAMRLLRRVQAAVPSVDILVGDPDRGYLTPHRFEALDVRRVQAPKALEGVTSMTATVWRLGTRPEATGA